MTESELEKKVTVDERKSELEELFKGEKQRIDAGTKWKTCRDKAAGQTWKDHPKTETKVVNIALATIYEFAKESLEEIQKLEAKINSANRILEEGCVDQDGCCPYTDDGVCYDDDCVLARLRVVLQDSKGA